LAALVTKWTTERGADGTERRPRGRTYTGATLLMSTQELLGVLEDWPARPTVPAAEAIEPAGAPAAPPREVHRVPYAATTAAPPPRPRLRRRLRCARRGHDPRPHRPQPHDEVVYRCLRCGMQLPPPEPREHPEL
jgi:hypothetical protein